MKNLFGNGTGTVRGRGGDGDGDGWGKLGARIGKITVNDGDSISNFFFFAVSECALYNTRYKKR
jgi:hypothetical protein